MTSKEAQDFLDYENELMEVLAQGMARAVIRDDGPFHGAADIVEIDEMRVNITGKMHFGVMGQEVLAAAVWLYTDHREYLDFLSHHLLRARAEEAAEGDND